MDYVAIFTRNDTLYVICVYDVCIVKLVVCKCRFRVFIFCCGCFINMAMKLICVFDSCETCE